MAGGKAARKGRAGCPQRAVSMDVEWRDGDIAPYL